MSKFIPYHIVCPLASCTRSNTCARYANYLKAKAEADSFEVLNLDHLKIAGDSCPYHLVTERQRWARGFARLCDSIPKGNSRYLNIYTPLYAAPLLQGKEWGVCTQSRAPERASLHL